MSSHKPEGHNAVSPYLIVDGARKTIEFLVEALGGEVIFDHDPDSAHVHHAEVRIDDSVVMLTDGAEGFPATPSHVHVYVEDVDAVYRRALEAGAESVQEPVQKGDPDKRGGVRDAGGTTWWIASHVG